MASDKHDTLVYRLSQMLVKLNQGEKLNPQALAEEFGVNLRTVQRDLNVRFAYLSLQKTNGYYHLDPTILGKLNTKDVERFAGLAGVRGLFPSLSDEFLRDIFDARIQAAVMVKGHNYENLAGKEYVFRLIETAILGHQNISFEYHKDAGTKYYNSVSPFKLINHKGIWYMAARDRDKLKSFSFAKIDNLKLLNSYFSADPNVEKKLAEEDGIWLEEQKKKIILKIDKDVASYFKRRKLVANQVIEKELEDGDLIVSAQVGHINQVVPIVRYWIPYIRIISPEGLQSDMEAEIASYLTPIR